MYVIYAESMAQDEFPAVEIHLSDVDLWELDYVVFEFVFNI